MYTSHFGLTEAPFAVTPDPRYLYMSEGHREAFAHLLYGVGEKGGFVQLTGEVGTGKTTLCRCLLEQLPPQADVAIVLNPRLTELELLATVCDELRISHPSGTSSLKLLVDALHRYLLDAHGRGRRTVLIIDEAQNLPVGVLEQIRLLTNLETAQEKLLQIILIGQPELIALLDRRELRQLAQRVTARYHLLPFSQQDTYAYIRHRLEIAGQTRMIFSRAAMHRVHRSSGGVPRLINVICDRALLGAYAKNKDHVDAVTAGKAATEVLARRTRWRYARSYQWLSRAAIVGAAIAAIWLILTSEQLRQLRGDTKPDSPARSAPSGGAPPPIPEQLAQLRSGAAPLTRDDRTPRPASNQTTPALSAVNEDARPGSGATLANVLSDPALRSDKQSAFASLYARWGLNYHATRGRLACERERLKGLECLFRAGAWDRLRRFNLPAIIELATPTGAKHYAMVTAVGNQSARLDFGGREFTFPLSEIAPFWDGQLILLWKPPALNTVPIPPGARSKDVEWLRQRLSELDGKPLVEANREFYDGALKDRVIAFQRSRSLVPDGIVGEETLTHLSIASHDPAIPVLSRPTP